MREELILRKVANGIKAVELAGDIEIITQFRTPEELLETIEEMIENGSIVEIEYVLPHMDYRIKSFLLPKGTVINIKR